MGEQIRPGLWRWTAPHPDWQPSDSADAPDSWPRDVGCVLYQAPSEAVFIDPLAPPDDPAFWAWADEICRGRSVSVLETILFHRRSREEFRARYGAATKAPSGVLPLRLPEFHETLHWIEEHRALVPGDSLIAGATAGFACARSRGWTSSRRASRSPGCAPRWSGSLAGLDVELVLVSHGEPVLHDGAAALAAALRAP